MLQVIESPRLPDDLSLIAGDAIANFRSALDHLAYQLVWKATGDPWERSQWPILDSPRVIPTVAPKKPDQEPAILGTLRRISANTNLIAKVHRHQPYGSVDDYGGAGISHWDVPPIRAQNFILRTLREMSNRDKHRLLLDPYLHASNATPPTCVPIRDCTGCPLSFFMTAVLQPGAEIARFHALNPGFDPKVQVDYDPRPELGVGWGGEIGELLDGIGAKVAQILSDFQPSF